MSGIFISYRRDDTADTVGRLYGDLVAYFGQERIFKDTSSMITGRDFVDQIQQAIAQCNVMLVLIGSRWLQLTDDSGARRIDEPGDYVRQEIELARGSGVEIIPVLAQGARMPVEEELPASIAFLQRYDAAPLRTDPDYVWDAQRLIQKILALAPQLTPHFNPDAALERARQGNVPAGWMVWRSSGNRFLVLTPDGVVQAVGPRMEVIDFASVESIDPVTGVGGQYAGRFMVLSTGMQTALNVMLRDGATQSWAIDRGFKNHRAIAQAIVAAHGRYAQSHRGLGVPQVPASPGSQDGPTGGAVVPPVPVLPSGAAASVQSLPPAPAQLMTFLPATASASYAPASTPPLAATHPTRHAQSPVRAGMRTGLIAWGAVLAILLVAALTGLSVTGLFILAAPLCALVAGIAAVRSARSVGASLVAGLVAGIALAVSFAVIMPAMFPSVNIDTLNVKLGVGLAALIIPLIFALIGGGLTRIFVRR